MGVRLAMPGLNIMGNPQLEKGYTRIANELLEGLAGASITMAERKILDVIIRMTYGYGKKEAVISMQVFIKYTFMSKSSISRTRKSLEKKNIIGVRRKNNGSSLTYYIRKNYTKWEGYPYRATVALSDNKGFHPSGTVGIPTEQPHINKENFKEIKKDVLEKVGSKTEKETRWQNFPSLLNAVSSGVKNDS